MYNTFISESRIRQGTRHTLLSGRNTARQRWDPPLVVCPPENTFNQHNGSQVSHGLKPGKPRRRSMHNSPLKLLAPLSLMVVLDYTAAS